MVSTAPQGLTVLTGIDGSEMSATPGAKGTMIWHRPSASIPDQDVSWHNTWQAVSITIRQDAAEPSFSILRRTWIRLIVIVERGKRLQSKSTVGGLVILVLAALYSFAAPELNRRYGWRLPQISSDSTGERVQRQAGNSEQQNRTTDLPSQVRNNDKRSRRSVQPEDADATETGKDTAAGARTASGADSKSANTIDAASTGHRHQDRGDTETDSDDSDDQQIDSFLREVSSDRFVSPAGLLYTPGSAEGHRLEHLRRHTHDDPNRPGPHGVFDGGMVGALKIIDEAYVRAKANQRTTKKVDRDRTIYTVDLGHRVGFVGGREGARRGHPMARRVRLVLEGNRVITAYPL